MGHRAGSALVMMIVVFGPVDVGQPLVLAAPETAAEADLDEEIFGLTRVHQFHLRISAEEYAAMEPAGGGFPFGPGGPGGGPGGRGGPGRGGAGGPGAFGPDAGAGRFGFDFEYVHGDFEADGENYKDVGVRYKGNGTYMMSQRAAKRSFKIDFDRHDEKQSFHGARKLNLNNGVMDPTKAREALAYSVFRAAGVPASKTAFAELRLSVPGKYDGEYLGLYTVVEQVDKAFLKVHFRNAKGLLLKPEGIRGVPYLGDDPAAYEKPYNAKVAENKNGWQRLIAFTKLVNRADDEEFRNEIDTYLDVDGFVRFLAANVLLSSLDGFIGMGHNYYLYLSPATNKFVFFPWDLDLAFGGFPMFGSAEQQMDLSIEHPHLGENKLIDRLLAIPDVKEVYRQQLRRLAAEVFTRGKLGKEIESVESVTRDLVARDRKAAEGRREGGMFNLGPPGLGAPTIALKTFVEKRAASVLAQLAGTSKGYVPAMAFGPGGPGGGPGRALARPALESADLNKDGKLTPEELQAATAILFKKWDKDGNGVLDEREIEAAINALVPGPQFGPPGGGERGRPSARQP